MFSSYPRYSTTTLSSTSTSIVLFVASAGRAVAVIEKSIVSPIPNHIVFSFSESSILFTDWITISGTWSVTSSFTSAFTNTRSVGTVINLNVSLHSVLASLSTISPTSTSASPTREPLPSTIDITKDSMVASLGSTIATASTS